MYEIIVYNGTFYRFTEAENGRTHTVAGEAHFKEISQDLPTLIVIPLLNKWGFCMVNMATGVPDNWQVFDTPDECHRKAEEYHDKIVVPLNKDWERRRKAGEFNEPDINDPYLLDRQD